MLTKVTKIFDTLKNFSSNKEYIRANFRKYPQFETPTYT